MYNMISMARLIRGIISERLSFSDLMSASQRQPDNSRIDRAKNVRAKSLRVKSIDETEAWTFSYKSQGGHSTTGERHNGYVRFLKENVQSTDDASKLDCMVDCTCPDYRYRWAYNNAKSDAGVTGNQSWSGNNGRPPRPRSQGGVGDYGIGLCKHLISLSEYLHTNVTSNTPDPDEKVPEEPEETPETKPEPTQKQRPSVAKPTIKSPTPSKPSTPSNSYSDSRESGGNSLNETTSQLYNRIVEFVKNNPEFEVPYE